MTVKKLNTPMTLSVLALAISGFLGSTYAVAGSHPHVSTAGDLDTTFGVGGLAAINASAGNDYGKAGVVQKDRKIVIATDIGDVGNRNIQVRRLNEDGSPDLSFGTAGSITIDLGAGDDTVTSIALDVHKGRIVIAGYHTAVDTTTDVIVARLNKDGSLDTTFGAGNTDGTPDGIVDISVGAGNDKGNAVAIQKDSKIVVAGSSDLGTGNNIEVIRLNTDGTLDASFGTANDGTPDGIVSVDLGVGDDIGNAVAIQENGRIVVAGSHAVSGSSDIVVARFLTDGTLDASFGTAGDGTPDGVVDLSLGAGNDVANAVAIVSDENNENKQDHGKIVIAGSSVQGLPTPSSNIEVVRLNKDGTLDNTFGTAGISNLDLGAGDDLGNSVALQANGRIVVAGNHFNAGSYDMVIARFLSNGVLDPSFGAGTVDGTPAGVVDISVGAADDFANSVALQGNMKIVVTGSSVQSGSANIEVVRLLQN